jgi:general secretion pathway protein I
MRGAPILPSHAGEAPQGRAFTLLEVMVAVAILGLSLTVILSAQVGLFSAGSYSQHISQATGLARCRMSELEEQFLKLGYPEVDSTDDGACCGGDLRLDMKCAWKVERIELPNPPPPDLGGGIDGGVNPAGSGGLNLGGPPGAGSAGPLGPLSALAEATGALPGGALTSTLPGGNTGLSSVLAAGAQGGTGAIAPLVMSFVYPTLKPMLEASIRKVTVTVQWREGMTKRDLEIVQWVTNPMKGGFLAGAIDSNGGGGSSGTAPASPRTLDPSTVRMGGQPGGPALAPR